MSISQLHFVNCVSDGEKRVAEEIESCAVVGGQIESGYGKRGKNTFYPFLPRQRQKYKARVQKRSGERKAMEIEDDGFWNVDAAGAFEYF